MRCCVVVSCSPLADDKKKKNKREAHVQARVARAALAIVSTLISGACPIADARE